MRIVLFFRHKSRDVGILLALGASKDQLRRVLAGELALMSLSACALGALLGTPLAWFIWQGFRLLLVDSEEMALAFDPHAYLLALAFSLFVVVMLFVMLGRFLRRTNILDVVNESRKSEAAPSRTRSTAQSSRWTTLHSAKRSAAPRSSRAGRRRTNTRRRKR